MARPWILIEEAHDLLMKHRLDSVGGDWLPNYEYARAKIIELLKTGELTSRPSDPAHFKFTLETDRGIKNIPLEDDGTIPGSFWIMFDDAFSEFPSHLVEQTSEARYRGNDLYFRQTRDVRDGGILIGSIQGVEVFRPNLPGNLPQLRGRSSKPTYDDDAIVKDVNEALKKGEQWSTTIAKAVKKMAGNSPDAARKRLLRA